MNRIATVALTLTALLISSLVSADAHAQWKYDCNHKYTKQQAIRALSKLRKKSDPYTGVMPWWPVALRGMDSRLTSSKRPASKQLMLKGKNYAMVVTREKYRMLNIGYTSKEAKNKNTLHVKTCTYRTGYWPSTYEKLKLVSRGEQNTRVSHLNVGAKNKSYTKTPIQKKGDRMRYITLIMFSPSYYTGAHGYGVYLYPGGEK